MSSLLNGIDYKYFARLVEARLRDEADNDITQFIKDEDTVDIDENDVDCAVEHVLENEGIDLNDIDEDIYCDIKDEIDWSLIEGIIDDIKEALRDSEEYRRDPLGYHGMSQKDFL